MKSVFCLRIVNKAFFVSLQTSRWVAISQVWALCVNCVFANLKLCCSFERRSAELPATCRCCKPASDTLLRTAELMRRETLFCSSNTEEWNNWKRTSMRNESFCRNFKLSLGSPPPSKNFEKMTVTHLPQFSAGSSKTFGSVPSRQSPSHHFLSSTWRQNYIYFATDLLVCYIVRANLAPP